MMLSSTTRMEGRVDFAQFRQLLESLESSEVSIRVRLSGEGWTGFSKLLLLSESAMILQNGTSRVIFNLRSTVEFEVDQPILGLSAHTRYEIAY